MVASGIKFFTGEQDHKVDQQGRISMPSRFREALKGGMVLSRGADRCVVGYTESQWEETVGQIASLPIHLAKNRKILRMTFGSAYQVDADRQGRVLLPSPLRAYAQINEDVVIVGMGNFLELWSKEVWEKESESLEEDAWQIGESWEERS